MNNAKQTYVALNNRDYKQPSPIKIGETFAGLGSMGEVGKQLNLNHTTEFIIEIDKYARATYLENHSVNNVYEDIRDVDCASLPCVDLLMTSPPCQAFSPQGKREGFLDKTRGTLTFDALGIVKVQKPKWVIFENVKGLCSIDGGKSFETILMSFKELGYKTYHKVLNAKHFGSPQNRERVFIVAIRDDIEQDFSFPVANNVTASVNSVISDDKSIDYSDVLFDASKAEPFTPKVCTDIKTVFTLPHIKFLGDRKIVSTHGISPCLLSGCQTKFYDEKNKLFRYLTIKEKSLIQGLNSKFEFPVSVSKSQAKKQLGNMIYIGVLKAILKNLIPQEYFGSNNIPIEQNKPLAA